MWISRNIWEVDAVDDIALEVSGTKGDGHDNLGR